MYTNIYEQIEDNWRTISQPLASRNVQRPELEAMRDAYIRSAMARFRGEETPAEFWVSDWYEAQYVKFLQNRDYVIYKKNCGLAVVK